MLTCDIVNLRFKHRGTKYGMVRTSMREPQILKSVSRCNWEHTNLWSKSASRCSLESWLYGIWRNKTEGSPIALGKDFGMLIDWLIDLIDLIWFDLIRLDLIWFDLIWCDLSYFISYPYAWTVNFEIRIEVQLRTHQPPSPNSSQTSAWCYMFIGC